MKSLGKSYESRIYPKLTHSFVYFQDLSVNLDAVADAWPRTALHRCRNCSSRNASAHSRVALLDYALWCVWEDALTTTPAATPVSSRPIRHTGLHITLWIAQVLLAVLFAGAGSAKAMTPLPELTKSLPYTADLPGWLVRFIGISEITGAVGLILPAISRVVPMLVAWASWGLCAVMGLATLFHLTRSEISAMPMTIVIGAVAAFVAWGRSAKAPIVSRR